MLMFLSRFKKIQHKRGIVCVASSDLADISCFQFS